MHRYTPTSSHTTLTLKTTSIQKEYGHTIALSATFALMQSLTLPMQGFMNAIVYGWTREDFVHALNLGTGEIEGAPTVDTNSDSDDSEPTLTTSYVEELSQEKQLHSAENSQAENVNSQDTNVSYCV